ncbi:MAG: class I SAM-dependent methyltransferase [Myxococcota bacterium]|nr:class I SAM-dependent methyltransferase [Myxococcota bacterium]
MKIHPKLGAIAPELGWLPSPRYLLRRARVFELIYTFTMHPKEELLEIGCGAGALLADLNIAGYRMSAVEHSKEARKLAQILTENRISPHKDLSELGDQKFDWVFAFEVLEHIEDDTTALREWTHLLNPNGRILLSVPAHQKKWGITDEYAGHYRRYEKEQLISTIESAGMQLLHIENYGFPLANMIEPIRNKKFEHSLRMHKNNGACHEKRTHQSGVRRNELLGFQKLYEIPFLLPKFIASLDYVQKIFSQKDWGNGYLVVAQK